jgi:hypothetical protein
MEILYYRGISGTKLLNVSRQVKGSNMGYHLAGDLVFKGQLSAWTSPSLWVSSVPGTGLGHLECFLSPTGHIEMTTREATGFEVESPETASHAHAQIQAVLVRKVTVEPRVL